MDSRALVAMALAGLAVGAEIKKRGAGSAAKKTVKKATEGPAFPIRGIAATNAGPVRLVVYEGNQDLGEAARDEYKRTPSFRLLSAGEPVPTDLPVSTFAIYGPETHEIAWELNGFPGFLILDLSVSGGIGGGPPITKGAPSRSPDAGMRYVLLHTNSGSVKEWSDHIDELLFFILFREATVPGHGKKERLVASDEVGVAALSKLFAMPSADDAQKLSKAEEKRLRAGVVRLTKNMLDVWAAEGEVLPPTRWRINSYRAPRGTLSIAYAVPGDPWALDWVWPDASEAEARGAVRKTLHRSRVPVGRKAALTLEGIFDPEVGFQWVIRGAFEFFSRTEMNRITIDETGGFPEAESGWGDTDEDKGLPLFQTGSGWKAAVGFGWTFMRLLALLHNGDRMDESGQQTRAALRKLLLGKGRSAWRSWYELALGDRKNEIRVVAQQHEVRPSAARQQRGDGFTSRPSSARTSSVPLDVDIPAYEVELEALVGEASMTLGRARQQTALQQQATAAPVSQAAPRRKKKRGAVVDRVFALGPTGRIAATAVLFEGDPEWWLLGEDREPTRALGATRPKPKDLL